MISGEVCHLKTAYVGKGPQSPQGVIGTGPERAGTFPHTNYAAEPIVYIYRRARARTNANTNEGVRVRFEFLSNVPANQ